MYIILIILERRFTVACPDLNGKFYGHPLVGDLVDLSVRTGAHMLRHTSFFSFLESP